MDEDRLMVETTAGDRVGELFGGIFDGLANNPIVQVLWAGIAAYVVILWLATAWWSLQDLRRRQADPAMPYLAAAMIVIASPVLFPLALIVYWILRPAETLAEARERELEELLEELDPIEAGCPRCRRGVEPSWLTCPSCRSRLAYQCAACGRAMELDWSLCAWCGEEFGGRRVRVPAALPAAAAGQEPPAASAASAAGPRTAPAAAGASAPGPGTPRVPPARTTPAARRAGRTGDRDSERVRA
jgi:hypothetical protein